MRELLMFSTLLLPLLVISFSSSALANLDHHEHSLKHITKRHDDIPLEFIMNSQEHSDIRRSVKLMKDNEGLHRISSDKFVVRRDQPDASTEVVGDSESVPDKFDQPVYDFMLPEGKSEKSTILAVVDFITRKHNVKPTFIVNFDENQWFDIGAIEKTKADNADVYKATVILKAGADVNILKTEGGLYKFVVEAQQGDVVLATTNISVDVLSLAPTTKRVRVTVPTEPKMMETTTMASEESTTSEELTKSSEVPAEPTSTSEERIEPSTTSQESTTTSEEPTTTPESMTSEEDVLTLGGSVPTTPDSFNDTPDDDLTSTASTSSTTSTSEEDEEVEVPESEGSGVEDVTSTTPESESLEDVEGSATSSSSSSTSSTSSTDAIESSGDRETDELLLTPTSSSESESPIDGPITILPLQASDEGNLEPIDAHFEILGAPENSIQIPSDSREGDVVRNVFVTLRSQNLSMTELVELSIEPAGILSIRPTKVMVGEPAALFINSPAGLINADGSLKLELIAKFPSNGAMLREPLSIQISRDSEQIQGSEMPVLREVEFGVLESAESGRTIGSIEGDMKIFGEKNTDRFSLVGNDIILTCGQFSTDKCLQEDSRKMFTLILMPRNGTLAPLQVTIRVQQSSNLRTSDKVIRISDNRIISPFAVITERTSKSIKLEGNASKFLGFVKAQEGLYQLIVVNSAASGRYNLQISLEDLDNSPIHNVDVFVENSQSHAHFRKSKYDVEIDAKNVKLGESLTQVELEGVPIDEAKIMVLDGNPGWVTVEDYGGKVKVGKFDGPIYSGKSSIRIGAVHKKTWTILTETLLELNVVNGEEKPEETVKSSESSTQLIEKTFDREKSEKLEIMLSENDLKLDPKSMFGIDEKGKRVGVDPTSITISKNLLKIDPSAVKTLRILSFSLLSPDSQNQKTSLSILTRLTSSPEYLEKVKKLAARPVFPEPWTREDNIINVEMNEELAPDQVVGVFPARNSEGVPKKIKISGDMSDAFEFDETTGELKIQQRIDFESLSENQKTFDLKLTSGEEGFESEAVLRIKLVDIDDNSPKISSSVSDQVEILEIPENLEAGSKIAEFTVADPDGSESFEVELSGVGSDNYRAEITPNGTLSIFIAENSKIDRESQDSHALLIQVSDVSKNSDRILLPIRILDVNDNAPEFSEKMYDVEVVEDWPKGVVIGKFAAEDLDLGTSSEIHYSIHGDSEVVKVNETSGVVTVAGDLWGMARDTPYKFEVVAEDSGTPSLNSTAILSLRVRAKGDVMTSTEIEFVEPKREIIVPENIPLDTKIYMAKAELRGIASRTRGVLTYSLKDLITEKDETFAIDKKSGDIFAVKPVDFEKRNEYTLLITATNSEDESLSSSQILKIHVENLEDNEPRFLQSANPVFLIQKNVSKPTAIGRLTAYNPDHKPVFYSILPTCGSKNMSKNFTIDPEFGEIVYHPKSPIAENSKFELCFLASSEKNKDVEEVFFDGTARNMRKVLIQFIDTPESSENVHIAGSQDEFKSSKNNQKLRNSMRISGNSTISRVGDVLDRIQIPLELNEAPLVEFELEDLQFVPANYELGRDVISPEGSVELNKKTGEIVANGKILDTPQGVYTAKITRGDGNSAVKQLHHIRNDRKLRYVLAMSRNEFGANSEKLRRQILEALEVAPTEKHLDVFFDEPMMDKKNSTWTSVCFYLTRDNAILDDKQMTSLISSSNGHIAKLHHIFKVVNVDACAPRATVASDSSSSSSSGSTIIPLNTLILIGVVGLLIIALIALLVFVCCVSRYQRYLKQKTERMRCNSSAGSYYKSPNLIPPPPPGYMHTPPLPPPPPPAAIAFY